MIGHLRGIATISGLKIFADSILPVLTRELGPDGFEVHVVGGYDPPVAAGNAFEHPAVVRRGQIEPPDDEFLAADVLLVPTPLRTGPRSRIITGDDVRDVRRRPRGEPAGHPGAPRRRERVSRSGRARASPGRRSTRSPTPEARTRVAREARRLYESTFAPSIAGARIVRELERVAAEPRATAVTG